MAQVRLTEVGTGQVRAPQRAPAQIRFPEVRAGEVRAPEAHLQQAELREVGLGSTGLRTYPLPEHGYLAVDQLLRANLHRSTRLPPDLARNAEILARMDECEAAQRP